MPTKSIYKNIVISTQSQADRFEAALEMAVAGKLLNDSVYIDCREIKGDEIRAFFGDKPK